jgi:hypothetical protein
MSGMLWPHEWLVMVAMKLGRRTARLRVSGALVWRAWHVDLVVQISEGWRRCGQMIKSMGISIENSGVMLLFPCSLKVAYS